MSLITKDCLIGSATCAAVFVILFGLIVSCGGGESHSITGPNARLSMPQILSHLSPTTAALPRLRTQVPLVAMIFQTSQQQASSIQQSFQGLSCNAFQFPGAKVNLSGATTGFIPMQVLADPYIIHPNPNAIGGFDYYSVCQGVFSQVGGGTSTPGPDAVVPNPGADPTGSGTLTNPGTAIYADGTLSTLIVTGYSVAGKQIRCSDLAHTAVVHDSDLVQPYFVIDTNSVVLAVGSTQLPLTCQLNIGSGDQAGSISVQWAKI